MGLELATGALAGATLLLNEIHEHPFLPYGIFTEHTVLQATQIALRTHQEEKLEALRNAVVNSTSGQVLEDDVRAVFLNLVD
ncbi:MAG TPA: hypothetical protein VMH03_10335, partial [Terriglobales bacterium]|nr:hypothetical protein [Terriglobales bacterium]